MKKIKTRYPNIYKYETKKGTRYMIRLTYYYREKKAEFSKSGFINLDDAKARLADAEKNIASHGLPEKKDKSSNMTLQEYYDQMKEYKVANGRWNKATTMTNDDRFKHFGKLRGKKLVDLSRKDYEKWIKKTYAEKDYSQETMRGFNILMMSILNDAVDLDCLDKNRLRRVNIKKEGYKPKNKTLTEKQYRIFMNAAKEMLNKDIYTMIYLTTFGLRRGEVLGIQKGSIEFLDDGLAKILNKTTRTKEYPEGKKPKTEKSDRIIVVNQEAARLLKEQIEFVEMIKRNHSTILNKNDFIFINPRLNKPYHIKMLNDAMDRVSEKCKVKVHPHMLRHNFATVASTKGINGELLRNYMGHTDVSMTQHYTHGTEEGARTVLRLIDDGLH